MRVFSAVKIQNELVDEISSLIELIEKYKDRTRVVPARNLHLTLRFLGNINDEVYSSFLKKISDRYRFFERFSVNVRGIGFFPNKNHPRIIWVGVEENTALREVYLVAEQAARDVGLPPENKFTGHITVGRIKSSIPADAVKNIEKNFKNRFWGKMIIEEITVFESKLAPGGPEYRELANIPLGGGKNGQE
ncbi:MAG: RNA 2',3'-cyclic phosphodiesterase [Candidatus Omnitrophica bacterium]|nr:RNA 2',3'-cyclic phosphodiesterase [Candidatus Omnitrophota bacterium]MCM8825057.1 RNA 2',3'-cyclic phosphodiesterase [Candidatus Omnitrophota bacterium]